MSMQPQYIERKLDEGSVSLEKSLVVHEDEEEKDKVYLNKKLMKTKNSMAQKKSAKFLTNEEINNIVLIGRKQCIAIGLTNITLLIGYFATEILLNTQSYIRAETFIFVITCLAFMMIILVYQLLVLYKMMQKHFKITLHLSLIGYLFVIAATTIQLVYYKKQNTVSIIVPVVLVSVLIVLGLIKIILIRNSTQVSLVDPDQQSEDLEVSYQKFLITDNQREQNQSL